MPRLSAVDQAFFLLETAERPMNIGVLFVLAPPPGTRGNFAARLVRTLLKCPVGAPFSYRLAPGPVKGLVSLVEEPDMDPAPQVHRHALPPGTDLQGLFARLCELHVQPLDRSGPLWEQHVYEGLGEGRVALYFKTHHGLIDGIGFLRILHTMVSTSRRGPGPRALWEGMRHVPPVERAGPGSPLEGLLQSVGEARHTAVDLLRLFWHQGRRDLGLGPGLVTPFVGTPDVLKAAPSPHRVLAHCQLPLARVRAAAAAGNAKINDVMLTLIDMAMHRYLDERGLAPDRPLVADIPVALEDHGGTGNRITILQAPMGRPGVPPAQRLADIVGETAQVKTETRTLSAGALTLYSILQHSIAGTIESLGLGELPMLANVVISNPAGFEHRVHFNGAEVELALPISVVAHHQVLNITVSTYGDALHVTFIALREAIPDLPRLAGYTVEALPTLESDLARPRRPRGGVARKARSAARGAGAPAPRRTPARSRGADGQADG
jgi:WS/DGAT/MGAT family acyltransferase